MSQSRRKYKFWETADDRALRTHSRRRTPVSRISKDLKRTEGAVRQRASTLGISVGHGRRRRG